MEGKVHQSRRISGAFESQVWTRFLHFPWIPAGRTGDAILAKNKGVLLRKSSVFGIVHSHYYHLSHSPMHPANCSLTIQLQIMYIFPMNLLWHYPLCVCRDLFGTMSPGWPGQALEIPRRSYMNEPGRGKSGFPYWDCCPCEPTSDRHSLIMQSSAWVYKRITVPYNLHLHLFS